MRSRNEETYLTELVRQHEQQTNKIAGLVSIGLVLVVVIIHLLQRIDYSSNVVVANRRIFLPLSAFNVLCFILCAHRRFAAPWVKYVLVGNIILMTSGYFFIFTVYATYYLILPIIISSRYFNRRFILRVSIASVGLYILACVLNLTMADQWPLLATAHDANLFDPWKRPVHALVFLIIPLGLIISFVTAYCIKMTESGRSILKAEARSLSRVTAVNTELQMAADIQRSMLPLPAYTTPDGNLTVEASEAPAKEVGGDFYDYYMINSHTLAVIVADVSDKGVPAAMFMMSCKKVIRCAAECSENLKEAIAFISRLVAESNESSMFLTMWFGVIDTQTGIGKYVNCGHPFPYIRSADGTVRTVSNEPDILLGAFPDIVPNVHSFRMNEGDTLVLYTDGITDALDKANASFGNEGIERALSGCGPTAKDAVQCISEQANAFAAGVDQFDDMTLLALHANKKDPPKIRAFDLTAGPDATATVISGINALLREVSCPDDTRRNIDVVIDEICTNISDYAYEGGAGRLSVCAEAGANFTRLVFTDDGPAFDPISHDKAASDGELTIGGLGIFFVKQLADSISYRRNEGSNELTVEMIWGM